MGGSNSKDGILGAGKSNCSSGSQLFYGILDPFHLFTPGGSECSKYQTKQHNVDGGGGDGGGEDDDKKNDMIKKIAKIAPFVIIIIIIMMVF